MHLQELKKLETRLLEPISIPVIGRCLQKKAVTALAEDNSPDAVKVLAKAVTRLKDEEIKDIVLDALGKLRNQRCIDAFCQVWADTRHRDLTNLLVKKNWVASAPVDVRVLSALKAKQLQVITNSGKEIVEPLFNAFQDKDTEIANRASECAISFTNPKAIDYICHKWAETRDKLLEELVCKGKYIARQPIELKVLTVLKVAKLEIIELEILELEIIQDCGKEIVDSLLNALKDKDAEIASRANECLPFFSNYDSIDYICQKWSKTRGKTLEQICQETQYAPREPSQRALFYFLTGQWDKYESLDYEHSLLQKVYELGDEKLRKRIADKARQAGRVELVKIITGVRQQSKKISDAEWEIIIGILITSKKYDDMWQLAQTAPARWSMLLLNKLRELQWTPQEIAIREQFVQLVSLASNCTSDVPVSGMLKSCHKILTGHTRQIVSLLINLDGDILVSGTNLCGTTRSIIRLWSLPSGKLMKTLDGHTDSASHLAITPNGKILVSASDRVSLNDDGTKNVFDANGYWGYTKEIWSPTEEEQKTI